LRFGLALLLARKNGSMIKVATPSHLVYGKVLGDTWSISRSWMGVGVSRLKAYAWMYVAQGGIWLVATGGRLTYT
jgi:hypothetical protein